MLNWNHHLNVMDNSQGAISFIIFLTLIIGVFFIYWIILYFYISKFSRSKHLMNIHFK